MPGCLVLYGDQKVAKGELKWKGRGFEQGNILYITCIFLIDRNRSSSKVSPPGPAISRPANQRACCLMSKKFTRLRNALLPQVSHDCCGSFLVLFLGRRPCKECDFALSRRPHFYLSTVSILPAVDRLIGNLFRLCEFILDLESRLNKGCFKLSKDVC